MKNYIVQIVSIISIATIAGISLYIPDMRNSGVITASIATIAGIAGFVGGAATMAAAMSQLMQTTFKLKSNDDVGGGSGTC